MPQQEQDKEKKSMSSSSYDSGDSSSSSESTISMPPSPDGGYGWVIVLSAFFVMVISDGLAFSFGVIYSELLKVFHESKSMTSVVVSLFYGVSLLCGPISSAIVTKYGCRKAQIVGGLITSAGVLLSAFVDSVGLLCFTFGIVAGFGLSLGYVTSVVIVAFYFEKKRSLATGLSVCGSGIGTFLFAPFLEFLIEEYGWRGSFVVLSGVTLNLVVCGALMRPLEFTPLEEWQRNLEKFENMSRTISKASLHEYNRSRHASNSDDLGSDQEMQDFSHMEQLSHSQVQLPTFVKKSKEIPVEILAEIRRNGSNVQNVLKQYYQSQETNEELVPEVERNECPSNQLMVTSDDHIVFADENGKITNGVTKKKHKKKSNEIEKRKNHVPRNVMQYHPIYRKDLFYRRSLTKFINPQTRSTSCPELHLGSVDEDSSDEEEEYCCPIPKLLRISKHVKKIIRLMFDLSILKNPSFLLFAFSNFVLYFWYDVPYVFLADYAKELEISNPAFIISCLGIVNTIGQILYGFIGDKDIDLTLLYGFSVMLSGLSVLVVPWFTTYVPLCIVAGLFGLFISANYALSTVILVEFAGMDKLTNAYGLTMMMQGIANMIGPPIGGKLYDESGSYKLTFITGGLFICFSGLLLVFVPIGNCLRSSLCHNKGLSRTPKSDSQTITMEEREMASLNLVVPNLETNV